MPSLTYSPPAGHDVAVRRELEEADFSTHGLDVLHVLQHLHRHLAVTTSGVSICTAPRMNVDDVSSCPIDPCCASATTRGGMRSAQQHRICASNGQRSVRRTFWPSNNSRTRMFETLSLADSGTWQPPSLRHHNAAGSQAGVRTLRRPTDRFASVALCGDVDSPERPLAKLVLVANPEVVEI